MNTLSLLVVASFGLAFLLGTARPWLRRRRARLLAHETAAARKIGPPPPRPAPPRAPPAVAPQHPARAPAPRRHFATLAEARRGIVLMTVLGPCRALEPPSHE
ncbi:MAG: hypothetical protein IT555_05645 [Acetobacteraceae bacterium]|nr:hypothetical protein [Acetobacteraceae bacterium]